MGTVKMDVEIGPATWTSELTATESTIEEDGDGLMKMDSLSEEQRDAVHTVLSTDANAFITGPAGTGKSYVLKMIAQELHLKGRKFEVLSTTGISAVDVGGTTIHSFTGIGIEDLALDDLQAVVEKSEEARTRWMESDLWIIDEVSMMHPKTFNNLDSLGRRIRRIKRPFGGIRVVMFGDFFQLPPISKGASSALTFCFETLAWRSLDIVVHTLTEPFRQKDEGFYRILSEARVGRLERESVSVLQSRLKVTLPTENGVEPTILYSKNDAVDAINAKKIAELKTEEVTYRSLKSAQGKFKGSVEHLYDKYFGNMRTPKGGDAEGRVSGDSHGKRQHSGGDMQRIERSGLQVHGGQGEAPGSHHVEREGVGDEEEEVDGGPGQPQREALVLSDPAGPGVRDQHPQVSGDVSGQADHRPGSQRLCPRTGLRIPVQGQETGGTVSEGFRRQVDQGASERSKVLRGGGGIEEGTGGTEGLASQAGRSRHERRDRI
jgi:hypothetical protein